MAISYKRLLDILDSRNISSYTLTRKYHIMGSATWQKIQKGGHIDTRTIDALCKFLNCQPGDILEYVEDGVIENDG